MNEEPWPAPSPACEPYRGPAAPTIRWPSPFHDFLKLLVLFGLKLAEHAINHHRPALANLSKQVLDLRDLHGIRRLVGHPLARHLLQPFAFAIQLIPHRFHIGFALFEDVANAARLLVGELQVFLDRGVKPPVPARTKPGAARRGAGGGPIGRSLAGRLGGLLVIVRNRDSGRKGRSNNENRGGREGREAGYSSRSHVEGSAASHA